MKRKKYIQVFEIVFLVLFQGEAIRAEVTSSIATISAFDAESIKRAYIYAGMALDKVPRNPNGSVLDLRSFQKGIQPKEIIDMRSVLSGAEKNQVLALTYKHEGMFSKETTVIAEDPETKRVFSFDVQQAEPTRIYQVQILRAKGGGVSERLYDLGSLKLSPEEFSRIGPLRTSKIVDRMPRIEIETQYQDITPGGSIIPQVDEPARFSDVKEVLAVDPDVFQSAYHFKSDYNDDSIRNLRISLAALLSQGLDPKSRIYSVNAFKVQGMRAPPRLSLYSDQSAPDSSRYQLNQTNVLFISGKKTSGEDFTDFPIEVVRTKIEMSASDWLEQILPKLERAGFVLDVSDNRVRSAGHVMRKIDFTGPAAVGSDCRE